MPQRADMFVDPDDDSRIDPPPIAPEREMLVAFLQLQRETLELKCSGLDAAQMAERAVPPSTLSLLGLVRHMAEVERGWFRRIMAGEDASPHYYTKDDPDADFDGAVADDDVVEHAFSTWHAEIEFATELVADAPDLDITGKRPDRWRGPMSLRWVLVHMIEEYARHLGHADLLRERIDGRLGQ